jgi:hypothetical protein
LTQLGGGADVTVVVPGDSRSGTPNGWDVPLVVSGTVHGRAVEVPVSGLSDVLARIIAWTDDDPAAIGCWGLRDDYSEPLVVPVRWSGGSAGRVRVTHLVRLVPGEPHGSILTATCGERLSLTRVDVVEVGDGLPCEPCMVRTLARTGVARPAGIQPAATPTSTDYAELLDADLVGGSGELVWD